MFYRSSFGGTPPVVKNLLIINGLIFLASFALRSSSFDLVENFGLHYIASENFSPIQFVTYMFLHGDFTHIFFNMFALWMFGRILENVWGPKRFLIYYFATGIGAGLIQTLVVYIELRPFIELVNDYLNNKIDINVLMQSEYFRYREFSQFYSELGPREAVSQYRDFYLNQIVTIGASGAVFGILLAFGMLFPNTQLFLLFPPIPIKAKYLVIGYGVFELFMGVSQQGSNVAHFAHLGGMLFGFILIKYWQKNTRTFY